MAVLALAAISNVAHANYWFQFGARGGNGAESNQGASISIQTITPQNVSTGSPAFWVGEDLDNGAFIQMGYQVENESALYPVLCDTGGCSRYEYLSAGQAEWFYEYFPKGYSGAFLGAIGPAGSAGGNGTFNNYGFYYSNGNWNFIFNGNAVGTVDLGSSSSGFYTPVGFGELANVTSNKSVLAPVIMQNLSMYKNGTFTPVASGYSYVGYGTGSQRSLRSSYGVQEVGSRVNYFEVGSGLSIPTNGTQLWGPGYNLRIESAYGNLSGSAVDTAYSKVGISAPRIVYIGNATRAVFTGWKGTGFGSYSGTLNSSVLSVEGNITEVAEWQLQYLVNVESGHGTTEGTGWYDPGSTMAYSINSTTIYENGTSRDVFMGWSSGAASQKGSTVVNQPLTLQAEWQRQYLVNATSQYGNVSGSGWVQANTTDLVSVSPSYTGINGSSRLAFYSWSNGNRSSSMEIYVDRPFELYGSFRTQYLYTIQAIDGQNNRIVADGFYANGKEVNDSVYLFAGERYNVTQVYYKGVWMQVNSSVEINSSTSTEIALPVYNVEVTSRDIFGLPVDAKVALRFANGTLLSTATGSDGDLIIYDAPYGGATGSAKYFILTEQVKADGGVPVRLLFLTPFDLLVFVPVIVLAVAIYLYSSRKLRGPGGAYVAKREEEPGFGTGMRKAE
ncbi:MAG TPA: hypothetical protein VL945_01290 [Candidatus Saccharimonadales bacterium]|nr:hypothetical protein [Candidatus Saccharimonadales bacterium]